MTKNEWLHKISSKINKIVKSKQQQYGVGGSITRWMDKEDIKLGFSESKTSNKSI